MSRDGLVCMSRKSLSLLQTGLIEGAARLVLKRACLVCAASGDKIPGHEACAAYVEIAREIRKLGTEVKR